MLPQHLLYYLCRLISLCRGDLTKPIQVSVFSHIKSNNSEDFGEHEISLDVKGNSGKSTADALSRGPPKLEAHVNITLSLLMRTGHKGVMSVVRCVL